LVAEDREIDEVPSLAFEEIDVDAAVDALGVRVVTDELRAAAACAREIEEQVGRAPHPRPDALHRARGLGLRVEGDALEGLPCRDGGGVEVPARVAPPGEGDASSPAEEDLDDESPGEVTQRAGGGGGGLSPED